jgi:hypothetical protein
MASLHGGCLCGSIRYSSEAEPVLTAICHCRHYQKQTSAAFSIVVAVPKGCLTIEGPSLKTFDDLGESGQPVQRKFCGNSGSPIMSYVEAMPDLEFIKAGTSTTPAGSTRRWSCGATPPNPGSGAVRRGRRFRVTRRSARRGLAEVATGGLTAGVDRWPVGAPQVSAEDRTP